MDSVRALKEILLFKDVAEPVLRVVAQAAEEVSVAAGETIVSEGSTPAGLYLIRSGTVRVSREEGKVPVVFGTGESLGEVPFLDGGPAGVNAVALERVDLLLLRPQRVEEKLAADQAAGHQFYRAVAHALATRFRRAADMITVSRQLQAR